MPDVCVSRSLTVICRRAGDDDAIRVARRLRRVSAYRDGGLGERRDPAAHRIGEIDLPFLDEHQRGNAGDRLGLRRDAEDRVGGHALVRFAVRPADRLLVDDLAVAHHESHGAGDLVVVDVALQRRIDSRETIWREAVDVAGGRVACADSDGAAPTRQSVARRRTVWAARMELPPVLFPEI